jgi:hypothetical protein
MELGHWHPALCRFTSNPIHHFDDLNKNANISLQYQNTWHNPVHKVSINIQVGVASFTRKIMINTVEFSGFPQDFEVPRPFSRCFNYV